MHNQYATAQIFTQQAYITKQDLINAGCQINAGGCDLLYEFGDLRYQLLVWLAIYYYVRTYVRKNSCHTQVLRFFVLAIHYHFLLTCSHRNIYGASLTYHGLLFMEY